MSLDTLMSTAETNIAVSDGSTVICPIKPKADLLWG